MTEVPGALSRGSAKRLLVAVCSIVAITFVIQTLVMVLLSRLPPHSTWVEALIDSTLLSILAFPVLRFLVLRPLSAHIARREWAEHALVDSEARYRSLFTNMLNGCAYCRMEYDDRSRPVDFVYLDVNRAFEALTGLTDVVGKRVSDVIPGIQQVSPELFEIYGRVASTGMAETFEFDFRSNNQFLTVSAYSPEAGCFVAVFEDITKRRRAEDKLRQAEEKYRSIFEHAIDGIYQTTPDGAFITANQAMARILGYASAEELTARSTDVASQSYVAPEGRAEFLRLFARDGIGEGLEYEVRCKDGSRRWVSENARAVRNAEGGVEYYEGILTDISERKQKERDLKLFRALIDHSSDGIEVVDPETMCFIDVNDKMCRDLGYSRDELLTMSVFDIDPGLTERDTSGFDDQIRKSGYAMFETIHRRKDGSTFPVEVNIARMTLDRTYEIVVARDITERTQAERAVRLQSAALNAAANAIVITDRDGTIEWVNTAFTASVGYEAAEVVGKNPRDLFKSGAHDRRFYKHLWDTLLAGGVWRGEMVNRRKDGSLYTEDMTITPMKDARGAISHFIAVKQDISERKRGEEQLREQAELLDHAQDAIVVRDLEHRITYWNRSAERLYGWTAADAIGRSVPDLFYKNPAVFYEAHDHVLHDGEWTGELQQLSKDGREVSVESRWTLVRDRSGAPKSVLVINTDITQRKKLEQQFLRAQRLESIGTLAGGIAHDLNNVLAPIMMSIDLLKLTATDDRSRSLLDTIAGSAQRGADMVARVLSFARGVEGRRVNVQVGHLIREMEKIVGETFPKEIRIRTTVSRDLWTVLGDPTQLHQVLLNLCINARDAMPNGGQITIAADNVTVDAEYAAMNIDAKAGPYVVIHLEDTGVGIPPAIIDKIFDPFFTTKEVGKGTGLGLSTSLTIVKQHGGFLRVSSEPGAGAQFQICLPAQPEGRDKSAETAAAELLRGDGETVLVVDDEISVREITRQTLEAFGYHVLLASDGAEAVALYAQHSAEIAVVITDMVMPVMDGVSTIQALVNMNAALRIIAISGVAASSQALPNTEAGVIQFLLKPYSSETLLRALRLALAKAP